MRLSLVWKWSRHTNYQWVYRDLYKKNGKDHRCDSIIIELFQTITSMHSKKMPKIKSCFVEKKEFEFFGQFAVSFFLSFFASTGGLAESRCDAERRLRWQRRKKRLSPKSNFFTFFWKTNNISGSLKIYHFGGNLFFYLKC